VKAVTIFGRPQEKPALDIGLISQVVAVSTVAVYILGFIVVNAFLARWHTASFDLANAQYIAAGLIFLAFLGIFYFVVWRRFVNINHDIEAFSACSADCSWPMAWNLFFVVFVLVELAFGAVVAAFWTAALLFRGTREQLGYLGFLSAYFVIDYYALVRMRVYATRPFLALPLSFLFQLAIVISAVFYFADDAIFTFIIIYFCLVLVGGLIVDMTNSMKISLPFTCFWIGTFLMVIAAMFGALSFQYVKGSIGGGEARDVEVYFAQSAPYQLLNSFGSRAGGPARLIQLAETPNSWILSRERSSEETVRVSKDAIIAIRTFGLKP